MKLEKKEIRNYLITIGVLFLLALALTLFDYNLWTTIRAVFGSVLVLFVPGFVIVKLYFKEIDIIERIALSFALSIAIVPLTVFYLNKLGMRINTLNSFLSIIGIISVSFVVKRFMKK